MSTRRRLTVTLDGRVAVIRGWRAADLTKEAGCKPIYAGSAGGWMIDRHRLGDLLAYLDERNVAVAIRDDGKGPHIARTLVRGAAEKGVGDPDARHKDEVTSTHGADDSPGSRKVTGDGGLW